MNRMRAMFVCAVLVVTSSCFADPPHIGYCFPMGARQGMVFEATVGGQYLGAEAEVYVSGTGVRVEVLDYFKEISQKEFQQAKRNIKNTEAQLADERVEGKDKLAVRLERAKEIIALQEKAMADLETKYTKKQLKEMEGKKQFNPQIAERLKVRISIAADAPPGNRELRVKTGKGLSNPIVFQIGTLPETVETEPNDDNHGESIQDVQLPALINGQVMPGDIDCFRFKATEGQTLVFDVGARKLIPYLADAVPGWFQAVVALYDENGDEVAFTDDYKFNPDPVLFYDVPKTGTYTLQIKDSIYRGREDFIYRIAAGELPFITSIFPLGAQEGKDVDIALTGKNLPRKRLKGTLPDTGNAEVREVSVDQDGYRSNPMPFAISEFRDSFEKEPNNTSAEPQSVELPLVVNGRIGEPGDLDVFSFAGKKGDILSIDVHARRLTSPLDSFVRLTGPGIETSVVNDDHVDKSTGFLFLGAGLTTHHADSYLLHELTETGTYFVEIGDMQAGGGNDYSYRLRLSPARPDFFLCLEPSGVNIAPGSTAAFTVRALRKDGFDGRIDIVAANLPEGFSMSRAEIVKGENTGRFTITAPATLEGVTISPEITGTALVAGKKETRTALPVEDQMQAFLYRHLVPVKELVLSASATPDPITLEVKLPKSGAIVLPLGKEVTIPVSASFEQGTRNCKLQLDQPPAGLSIVKSFVGRKKPKNDDGTWSLRQGSGQGAITLKAEEPLKPGFEGTLVVTAVVKLEQNEEARFTAPAIPIKVVAPKP